MQFVNLGRTGLKVSRIALGMMTYGTPEWRPWVLTEGDARPVVKHAVDGGINFFDTADMYSAGESEVLTGKCVREFFRREEVVVATKVRFPVDLAFRNAGDPAKQGAKRPNVEGLSRKRLFHAVDESLRRLGTDYIDLWQIHRANPQGRSRNAYRGNDGGAARHRKERQSALHRCIKHVRLAIRQSAVRGEGEPVDALRLYAEPLQPGLPRGRAGNDSVLP